MAPRVVSTLTTPQLSYEEDMTATSLEVNFMEELSDIEQRV